MTEEVERSTDVRYLILMRHAKSDWGDESLSDHDRPLNRRGLRDAPNMARWLADLDLIPDMILCSSSVRTRETVDTMMDVWTTEPSRTAEPTISFSEDLYHATPEEIIGAIRCDGGTSRRLLVVAHNPGMTSLVSHFAQRFTEMPTAAVAVFQTDCERWNDLQPEATMQMIEQMGPKGLR